MGSAERKVERAITDLEIDVNEEEEKEKEEKQNNYLINQRSV
jgi:hypothetical protein